ncbi:PREDICTED: stamen-specific protein FIL1-like [Nelumbo nucifera]|uniref:Stamen-specific protein FIL1-like n=2 Tax=Nelumbo nucifera TaxID=4432 RepID=A0A1U8AKX7_NELNU|nr:PREDICTED: stamen-specific protein FIL1-like [Nelumbo nucifera]DAD46149.1 TPA_asm: hypothetical protein HUJ06_004379 [Nelumbo nucifera]
MAAKKSLVSLGSRTALMLLLIAVACQTQMARSQNCANELTNLTACAPFVLPGVSTQPNAECCNALHGVDQTCLCSTLQIVARMPTQCRLPPMACPTA